MLFWGQRNNFFQLSTRGPPSWIRPGHKAKWAQSIEMNITGTLPSDKLPIFFLKPNFTSRHACLEVKITRVYDMIDWLSALRMHEKTGHDNKGMSGHGFTFPVGGSVPVIFISMAQSSKLQLKNGRQGLVAWRTSIHLLKWMNFVAF
jgi:hypothetical protein